MEHETVKLLRRIVKRRFSNPVVTWRRFWPTWLACCFVGPAVFHRSFFSRAAQPIFRGRHGHRPLGFIWSMKIGLITNSSWKVWTSEKTSHQKSETPIFCGFWRKTSFANPSSETKKRGQVPRWYLFWGSRFPHLSGAIERCLENFFEKVGKVVGTYPVTRRQLGKKGWGGFHGMPVFQRFPDPVLSHRFCVGSSFPNRRPKFFPTSEMGRS